VNLDRLTQSKVDGVEQLLFVNVRVEGGGECKEGVFRRQLTTNSCRGSDTAEGYIQDIQITVFVSSLVS
jgi:hypothetical protein